MVDGDIDPLRPFGCAACQFLERLCFSNCPLATHFPPESWHNFAEVKILLEFDSAVESVRSRRLPLLRRLQAEIISDKVAELGSHADQARRLLVQALLSEAAERQNAELQRYTMLELLRAAAAAVENAGAGARAGPGPGPSAFSENEGSCSEEFTLGIEETNNVDQEPAARGGGRELTPAEAVVMGWIWDSFVEVMEMPIRLAVSEFQQRGITASENDDVAEEVDDLGGRIGLLGFEGSVEGHVQGGPSDSDRKEEKESSSSDTENVQEKNNH